MSPHTEGLCRIDGVDCYRIRHSFDGAFLADRGESGRALMYISSRGAYRRPRERPALSFPYRTDDLLHAGCFSGPWTGSGWERIVSALHGPCGCERRHLAKSVLGDRIVLNPITKDWDWWLVRGGPSQ